MLLKFIVTVFVPLALAMSGCCFRPKDHPQMTVEDHSPLPAAEAAYPLIKSDIDLKPIVLAPRDLAGLFPSSYSIVNNIDRGKVKGIVVTYQTESIPHTLAFAKGYSTRVEIYEDPGTAVSSFKAEISHGSGIPIPIGKIGEESMAWRGEITTPEGFVVSGEKYFLIFRHRNVIVSITVKTSQTLPPQRLEALGVLVLNRLRSARL